MTMAIQNTPLSDLIAMDNTFASRCRIRKSLIEKEPHEILACNHRAAPAVSELYTWLTATYLPRRFPGVYTIEEGGQHLLNTVTNDRMPLTLDEDEAETALQLLGENIDTEFLVMLPTDSTSPTKYRLEAFVNCFPSGFNTRSKLNLLLSEIHDPVPGYKQK
jgi:hypothetical protein